MPSRARSINKVIKVRRGSRTSSLSSAAQEQLEQFAQQAAANNGHHNGHHDGNGHDALPHHDHGHGPGHDPGAGLDSSVDLNAANILVNGTAIGGLHATLHQALGPGASFPLDQLHEETPRTAHDIAMAAYGDEVKIDSALCKKLAREPALREPTQRRHDQKLNIERRSNVEALLAHVTGELAPRPCKNCHKGHGPWTQCVVYDGQMCGSCSNCWFNASGSRCTFHENNHPQPHGIYAPPAPSVPAAPTPASAAPPLMSYHPTGIPQPSPPIPPMQADISHWGLADPTKRLVNDAMGDVSSYTRKERHIARIEAAAKELGMRIAEYDEYLRSPEGMAQQATSQPSSSGAEPEPEPEPDVEPEPVPESSLGGDDEHVS